ncbi:MH2 domain protein [Dictyocaulus viviparus]|uniref:Mothers against decapentaplegic homolog n=1 Tax=Dictyocaulus viviparus TaxID=29172 RepID=A0A0D8YBI4_DICVI|nr:MH2 domain protein [Dictyocaulus viviparus]
MRGFDAEDVEVIRKAVESGGIDSKACAPGPPMDERPDDDQPEEDSGLIPQIDRPMSMPYLCCKLWRWKDLQVDAALHRLEALPWCRFGRVTINNATVSCCNPYHYALWIRPETSCSDEDSLRDNSQREVPMGNGHLAYRTHMVTPDMDLSTHLPSNPLRSMPPTPPEPDTSPPGTSTSSPEHTMVHNHAAAWGHMSRWDRKDRVGESLPLTGPFAAVGILSQSVHDAQPVCSEWDLKNEVSFALIRQSEPIGSDAPEDVWLYNSGTRPLFICMTAASSLKPDTLRLSPGYCVRVHKGEASASAPTTERAAQIHRRMIKDPALSYGNLVISVGRGWGPNYSRLYVTDIPCRYEVSFSI